MEKPYLCWELNPGHTPHS